MTNVTIKAADGFELDAYEAAPASAPRGCVVVVQEIFGVNAHIREVCDGYAKAGYLALAPALFDRVEKGIELGYDEAGMTRGVGIARGKLNPADALADIQAAINYLTPKGKVGIVGYCFGGLMAWLSACQLDQLSCASGYYGGGIAGQKDLTPKVPTILHFGNLDAHIPMTDVEAVQSSHPSLPVYVYDADHGFNCDHRDSYDKAAAELALERTLDLFDTHLN